MWSAGGLAVVDEGICVASQRSKRAIETLTPCDGCRD